MMMIGSVNWKDAVDLSRSNYFNFSSGKYSGIVPTPDKIGKAEELLPGKKNAKTREVYYILFIRSVQNNGDTKITNEKLAKLIGQSKRSVIRHIKKLEKLNLIVTHKRLHRTYSNNVFGFRTERSFTVWLGLAVSGYKIIPGKHIRFMNDIRADMVEAVNKIPRKWKISEPEERYNSKSGEKYTIAPKRMFLSDAGIYGFVPHWVIERYHTLVALQSMNVPEALEVLGYEPKLYYKIKAVKLKSAA